ncbi:hypothetical protein [Crocosphaera watsonii]|uniref:Uncharacterized protein n=1 Tax=Crocosphaera watsonii WH 8502 TaxID=423474 RepID=T2IE28_CROWT|nr:hypothetical protein [Crocosphaera watsonii]CCQ51077.1 hypothetical protein CWATWH8502_2392 [Crocosphaera watsonii WH 8502]
MTVQDDARENQLIKLFQLEQPPNRRRNDTDALLNYKGKTFYFELKSTTKNSVITVRDFGIEHIKKWQNKHWIIGFYDQETNLKYCHYASPKEMSKWIKEKEQYIAGDFKLAQLVPNLINLQVMYNIVGEKQYYTIQDAKKIQKRQYTLEEYHQLMDRENGYSPQRMLQIIRDRCEYIMRRGSTLNNPHIPASYFNGWEKIIDNRASKLRQYLDQYLD